MKKWIMHEQTHLPESPHSISPMLHHFYHDSTMYVQSLSNLMHHHSRQTANFCTLYMPWIFYPNAPGPPHHLTLHHQTFDTDFRSCNILELNSCIATASHSANPVPYCPKAVFQTTALFACSCRQSYMLPSIIILMNLFQAMVLEFFNNF